MKISFGFRFGVVICIAALFICAVSFLFPVQADKAGNAAKAAEAAVALAEKLAEECRLARAHLEATGLELDVANSRLKDAAGTSEEGARQKEQKKALQKNFEAVGAANRKCGDAKAAREAADAAIKKAEEALKDKTDRGGKDDDGVGKKLEDLKKRAEALKPKPEQASIAPPSAGQTTESKTANGLRIVTFDTPPGRVTVNLPDDMRAGDTISGTVVEEPKGTNKAEKEKNQKALEGMVIDLEGTRVKVGQPRFTWVPPVLSQGAQPRYQLRIIEVSQSGTPAAEHVYSNCFIPAYEAPKLTAGPTDTMAENVNIHIPSLGQAGRPVVITGPFDGDSSNTKVDFKPNPVQASFGVGGGTPVVGDWNSLTIAAESPRQVVFTPPPNVSGPMEIRVKEGTTETKGTFRNVGVNLTAPKTSLLKGESTTLKIEVSGLQGITQPVPLTLTSQGVITMEGGPFQQFMIQPGEVDSGGNYSILRNVTGVQTGAWAATATVVTKPFDFCLQDENTPANVVMLNSFTGDYFFKCPGCDFPPGKAFEIKDFSFGTDHLFMRLGPGFHGAGHPTIQDCRIKVQEDSQDRKVWIEFDACGRSGNASIEQSQPQLKFTITDRNIQDNICAVP